MTELTRRAAHITASQLGLARAGAGVVMLARPTALPRVLGVDSASATTMAWSTRMLGAREIAIGLGAWSALRHRDGAGGARLWLLAGVLSDGVDALALAGATGAGRVGKVPGAGITVLAAGAAAVQIAALRQSGGERRNRP